MKIEIIDDFETFQKIRDDWDFVYEADLHAQFFLSWIWLSGQLGRYDKYGVPWFILAARSSTHTSNYVAFFPLRISVNEHNGIGLYNELFLAGVADLDHTGFICLPEHEEEIISTFATHLQQQKTWFAFEIKNIQKADTRISLFLKSFSGEDFEIHQLRNVSELDHIDYSIVSYVPLPESWDQYLQKVLSSNTRQKIKRFLRRIESSDEFHFTHVNAENLERHIEILLEFWKVSWEGRKGSDWCQIVMDQTSYTLRHCFENKCLYLPVLWKGEEPLGAIANLMDFSKRSILFLITGRNETVKDPPSGIILHAYGIQYAIQNGFKVYSFMMGNEAYKFSFGAKERSIKTIVIKRKNLINQGIKLDIRTIPEALQISVDYHQANRLVEAGQGYRQILEVQPQHPEALYGLAVVMQRQEEYQAAENLLRSLLQVQPNHTKAWFSLGTLHQIQGQLSEAETAYQQALTLQPESSAVSLAIYHNLAYTLQQQGKLEDAIACYQKARDLQPDSIEADVGLANALHAQGKLSSEKQVHYAAVNNDLGTQRQQAGDLRVAIEYYRQAIAMNPDLVEAYCNLGQALQEQGEGKLEDAIACYQKAQELQPDSIEADVGLANALHAQGKLSSEKQVHYAAVNNDLGTQRQQAGDLRVAIEYYRQAIAMNPDLVEARDNLRLALEEQNDIKIKVSCAKW
jgi:tetratricopeptide (TPR) repeat protein